jgi:hypothetical protein
MSPEIQNELITSVSECMMNEIKKEVSEAEFVALTVDEATHESTMSTVLRYLHRNGDV